MVTLRICRGLCMAKVPPALITAAMLTWLSVPLKVIEMFLIVEIGAPSGPTVGASLMVGRISRAALPKPLPAGAS